MRLPISNPKTKLLVRYLTIAILALVFGAGIGWYNKSNKKAPGVNNTNTKDNLSVLESIPQPLKNFEDYGITIEKLKISAPIIPQVDGANEKVYYGALEKGVAQFKGSVDPNSNGNLFVFGHSSFFKGVSGDYKEIFKELNLLQTDDEFVIYFQKVPYRYKVTKSFETSDKDWSLIDPTPEIKDDRTITLMTCWPPGTISKRWGVVAKQI